MVHCTGGQLHHYWQFNQVCDFGAIGLWHLYQFSQAVGSWHGMVRFGMGWDVMGWDGMVWYGMKSAVRFYEAYYSFHVDHTILVALS